MIKHTDGTVSYETWDEVPKNLRPYVTQQDLQENDVAQPRCTTCPVARAVKRALNTADTVFVTRGFGIQVCDLDGRVLGNFDLPSRVAEFVTAADRAVGLARPADAAALAPYRLRREPLRFRLTKAATKR